MSEQGTSLNQDVAQQFLRRGQLIQYILAFLLLVLLVWALVNWWSTRDEPAIRDLEITTVEVVSPTSLCPSDTLMVKISVHIEGEGNIELDTTVQQETPAKTVIFSNPLRFSVIGPIDQEYYVPWRVPERYRNFETGTMEPIDPGSYFRIITLSAQGYRYTFSDLETIKFSIKEDCNNGPTDDPVGDYGSFDTPHGLRSLEVSPGRYSSYSRGSLADS